MSAAIDMPVSVSSDERQTPQWLFDALDAEFRNYLGLDANATCPENGLTESWADACAYASDRPDRPWTVWINPPYGRGSLIKWLAKGEEEAARGVTSVFLIPGDTSTAYWHRYALRHERRYLKSRLSFEGAPRDKSGRLAPAKFGSVIVVMRPSHRLWTWG